MRESQRDRSTRERAQDDGAQAAERKRVKRDQQAAEKAAAAYAAAKREVKVVDFMVTGLMPAVRDGRGCVSARWMREKPAEFERAERDWQQRVREGRFVRLFLKPSRALQDLDAVIGDHGICARIARGGRPRNDGTLSGVVVGPNTGWVPRARLATCVRAEPEK